MADGTPRRRRKLVTNAETLARVDLVLSLLSQVGVPCQGHRLLMALRRAGHSLTEYAIDYAIELSVKEHLVDQRGEVQHREWAITPKGAARVAHRADEHSNRVCGLASGSIRVCPDCDVEHPESESGTDLRRLRGISDHCAKHRPAEDSESESVIGKSAAPLRAQEIRILGFLVAHRERFDVEPSQRHSAEMLRSRGYIFAKIDTHDIEGKRRRVPLMTVRASTLGVAVAEELGLVCPGRESGECEECRKTLDNGKREG
jgi:hypothetical protein